MPAAEAATGLDADVALLETVARQAGAVALRYFRHSPQTWQKANDSPVTEADIAVNALLAERLLDARPDYGWLSEETPDDLSRLRARRSFVIDPIDGTREFIAGGPGWTISVAIVENGRPVAAVLYGPALGEMYSATAGQGARRDGTAIRVSSRAILEGARLSGPKGVLRRGAPGMHLDISYHASLAYRIALVADGRLDGAAAKAAAQDWDLAAADLLVHEAGGSLASIEGTMLRYDRPDTRHPAIVAAPSTLREQLAETLRRGLAAPP